MNVEEWVCLIIKELLLSSELKKSFINISSSFKCYSVWTSYCINVRWHFFKNKSLFYSVCYKSASMSFNINVKSSVFCHFIKDHTLKVIEFCNESVSLCVSLSLWGHWLCVCLVICNKLSIIMSNKIKIISSQI